jgi:hypothetical protein
MDSTNPYRPLDPGFALYARQPLQRSKLRAAMLGFFAGSALPVGLGVLGLVRQAQYRAANEASADPVYICGNGELAATLLIVFVGPICGVVGCLFGLATAAIRNAIYK